MAAKKRTTKKKSTKARKARIPKTWAAMARMMDRVGKKFDTIPKSKRKSRRLSGAPEEHARTAGNLYELAEREFNRVEGFLKSGDRGKCQRSFQSILKATTLLGGANRESAGARSLGPSKTVHARVRGAESAAESAFNRTCVKQDY